MDESCVLFVYLHQLLVSFVPHACLRVCSNRNEVGYTLQRKDKNIFGLPGNQRFNLISAESKTLNSGSLRGPHRNHAQQKISSVWRQGTNKTLVMFLQLKSAIHNLYYGLDIRTCYLLVRRGEVLPVQDG